MGLDSSLWLAISGLPEDATPRELHVLFSACPGYLKCKVVSKKREGECEGVVQFDSKQHALQAIHARRGTTWRQGARPVELDVRQSAKRADIIARSPLRARSFSRDSLHGGVKEQIRVAPGATSSAASSRAASASRAPSCCSDSEAPTPRARSRPAPTAFMPATIHSSGASTCASSVASSEIRSAARKRVPPEQGVKRKAEAETMIERAMASRKKNELEMAIEMGQKAGICESILKAPREALANHERRIAARQSCTLKDRQNIAQSKLLDAMAHFRESKAAPGGQKIKALRQAIQSAKVAAVGDDAMGDARLLLQLEECRQTAQDALEEAVHSSETALELREAIEIAQESGVDVDTLQRAAHALVSMEEKARARDGLQAAIDDHRRALLEGDALVDVTPALQRAKAAGLDEAELVGAVAAIAAERQYIAQTNLEEAMCGKDISALHAAIQEGVRAKVDHEVLDEAERVLFEHEHRVLGKARLSRSAVRSPTTMGCGPRTAVV